jgi:hypothetical protein
VLAGPYGTPAYVLDEVDVLARCRTYVAAFRGAEIAYADQAFSLAGLAVRDAQVSRVQPLGSHLRHWRAASGCG